ncbi:MAG: A/G-specific adenine glycosylase [Myxococcales bacterium]|nr:A/G-specific adenine glycosylase [Myxococcales bacterium]MDH3843293.1 A/G-specific adenine glycosylase [Myxococcales bacterium]
MASVREKLLVWFDREGRDLPWRRTRDPYAIWVSEVMLQQTRVDTVIPYYERFLSSFPTIEALAEADEDAVLSHWSGLGYYRRARLLHRGVREVVAEYGSAVPEDAEARRGLPGVGRYTAGAIGSIAFDKEEPVVDGNVSRVLSRLFRIDTPLGTTKTTNRFWDEAARLVLGERPGDLNQALMELGARICTPKNPRCQSCPVSADCKALGHDEVDRLPVKRARKAPKQVELAAVVATRGRGTDRKVWLIKGDQPLFGGLWGVPMAEGSPRKALVEASLEARLRPEPIGQVDHVLTHRRLRIAVFLASAAKGIESKNGQLFTSASLQRVGVSTLTRKILGASVGAAGWGAWVHT